MLVNQIIKLFNVLPSHRLQLLLSSLNSLVSDDNGFFRPLLIIKDKEKDTMIPFKVENFQSFLIEKLDKNIELLNQYINYDIKFQLPNLYNMKTDKMSMAASLEARTPFLDQKVVEWASTLPINFKLKGNTEKYILRMAMKDVLPPQILKRKKKGFGTPVNFWLKTGMNEISAEILERLEKRKTLIKPDYIQKVKKNRSIKLYQYRVWILIMFELWYETFIEKDGLKQLKF